jgi:nicotinamide-nucleotide amidase
MLYDKDIIDRIGQKLLAGKLTVAVAESVTSGNLQAAFSLAKDASRFFQGGITAYNVGQKCRHLLVEPTHALECNAVSQKVAMDMAQQVTQFFSSDYGIAITGYAVPLPEAGIQDLFAYFAISQRGKILMSEKISSPTIDSYQVQVNYVNEVLKEFGKVI